MLELVATAKRSAEGGQAAGGLYAQLLLTGKTGYLSRRLGLGQVPLRSCMFCASDRMRWCQGRNAGRGLMNIAVGGRKAPV